MIIARGATKTGLRRKKKRGGLDMGQQTLGDAE
jgi:hypothetical protein